MMSRRELGLLRAMYQHGTVTAAAQAVHMSQPAASALLQGLELRLGFALFSRDRRRLQLTQQARALMPDVLHALSALDAVDRLAGDIRQGAGGRLHIGAVPVASALLLPPALRPVRARHPALAVAVRTGTALELMDMAADHRIELGVLITGGHPPQARIVVEPIAPLDLYAVCHPTHPAAQGGGLPADLAALAPHGLVVLAPGLPVGQATRRALDQAGLGQHPLLEVAQSMTACAFAAQGLGVALVETLGARDALARGLCVQRLQALPDTAIGLVHPRDKPLAGAGQLLRESLIARAAELTHLPTTP